jgi:uncharacterized protein YbaR (Trm112 family)
MTERVDPRLLDSLVCPVDGGPLFASGNYLTSENGKRYPIVDGVPVLLRDDLEQTMDLAHASINAAHRVATDQPRDDPLFVNTIGASELERETARQLYECGGDYDPVVAVMIGATSVIAYQSLRGVALNTYPIPAFRFPTQRPGNLLDIAGVIWRRGRMGKWPLSDDRLHIHYILVDGGMPQNLVVGRMMTTALLLGGLGASLYYSGVSESWSYVAFMLVCTIYFYSSSLLKATPN